MLWFRTPDKVYFKKGCMPVALDELGNVLHKKKAFIVTDSFLYKNGYVAPIEQKLDELGIQHTCFFEVAPDPTLQCAEKGVDQMRAFEPDTIIALGGGSAMDAAKIMWVMYEHPEADFEDMAMDFMDIRKRVFTFPKMGEKAYFVAIPTSSGTGSEVTPFAIITDAETGVKWPIADYELLPNMAIVDVDNMMTQPKGLTSASGIDVMTHAIEAYVSTLNCDYTDALALHAIKMIHNDLKKSYDGDMDARDAMHNAQCLAGMAFSNALLGIVHSMAHKTGAAFSGGHIIHGCANAMYLPKVIKYNSKDATAAERYAQIAKFIDLKGETTEELVDALIAELRSMNDQLDIPQAIKNYGPGGVKADVSIIDEKEFMDKLPETAKNAIADACTGSNPRQPSQEEMEKLLKACYYDLEIDF